MSYTSHLLLSLAFVLLLLGDDVSGRRRRATRGSQSDAPGPNMCRVQHVLGSKDRFFTHCLSEQVKVICERPTYLRWECCSGYSKTWGEAGCPNANPLGNIMETAEDLDLDQFMSHAELSGIDKELKDHGPYTVFAPTDEAIREASEQTQLRLSPQDDSLLYYHVAPGRLNISTFKSRNQEFITLMDGFKVRVNKYAYGVATVNCARILRPDEMATNGIVHVIDKVIHPSDVQGTIADRLEMDKRFSKFQLALLVSDMAKKLKNEKRSLTVLAPTNEAFDKLPSDLQDRILNDAETAESVIKRHVVNGVYCADAIVVSVGLKTMDDARLLFRCKKNGLWVNQAKVTQPDIVAENGVLHGINTVLLPDSVKTTEELLADMGLDKFLDMARGMGLNETLNSGNLTFFAPTNEAMARFRPPYDSALTTIKHHMVKGRVTEEALVGESELETISDIAVKIKVNIYRDGQKTLDKAKLDDHPRECKNAVIHKVDSVMVPPKNTLMDQLMQEDDLSEFRAMVEKSGIMEALNPEKSYTLVAPNNYALSQVNKRQLQAIIDDPERLFKYVQRHFLGRMVLKCSVPRQGVYTMKSLQGDETDLAYDYWDRLHVNKHARVKSEDVLTSNGVLYKIDHVLICSCERDLRNRHGQYFVSPHYRRRY